MANFATNLRNVLFGLFVVCVVTLSFSVKADTCGICKDSYLSCVSRGVSSSSCDSQMRSCQSACAGDVKNSSGIDFGSILIISVIGLFAFFYLYGFLSDKQAEKEVKEEQERRSRMTPEEIAKEQEEIDRKKRFKETFDLRETILSRLQNMTVDEITEFTKSNRRSTTAWLNRNGYTCKDHDGAAKREAYLSRREAEKNEKS